MLIDKQEFLNTQLTRWCNWCGKTLPAGLKKQFCNTSCQRQDYNARRREGYREQHPLLKCKWCSSPTRRKHYCSDECSKESRRKQWRDKNLKESVAKMRHTDLNYVQNETILDSPAKPGDTHESADMRPRGAHPR